MPLNLNPEEYRHKKASKDLDNNNIPNISETTKKNPDVAEAVSANNFINEAEGEKIQSNSDQIKDRKTRSVTKNSITSKSTQIKAEKAKKRSPKGKNGFHGQVIKLDDEMNEFVEDMAWFNRMNKVEYITKLIRDDMDKVKKKRKADPNYLKIPSKAR